MEEIIAGITVALILWTIRMNALYSTVERFTPQNGEVVLTTELEFSEQPTLVIQTPLRHHHPDLEDIMQRYLPSDEERTMNMTYTDTWSHEETPGARKLLEFKEPAILYMFTLKQDAELTIGDLRGKKVLVMNDISQRFFERIAWTHNMNPMDFDIVRPETEMDSESVITAASISPDIEAIAWITTTSDPTITGTLSQVKFSLVDYSRNMDKDKLRILLPGAVIKPILADAGTSTNPETDEVTSNMASGMVLEIPMVLEYQRQRHIDSMMASKRIQEIATREREKFTDNSFDNNEHIVITASTHIDGDFKKVSDDVMIAKWYKNVIDSIQLQVGDRVILENQMWPRENGIYYITEVSQRWAKATTAWKATRVKNNTVTTHPNAQVGDNVWIAKEKFTGTIAKINKDGTAEVYQTLSPRELKGLPARCVDEFEVKQNIAGKKECEELGLAWDSPCVSDFECSYFENTRDASIEDPYRGGCIGGFCELPIGIKRSGFTKNKGEPVCKEFKGEECIKHAF